MRFRTFFTLAFIVLGAASFQVEAQVQRVAVVNPSRILKESNAAKDAQLRFEQQFAGRAKELTSEGEDLKAATEKYQTDTLTLSESQRNERRSKLDDQSREFQKKRNAFIDEKSAVQRADTQRIIELARKVVKRVAEAEKFGVVIQDAVYVAPVYDITDKVLAAMNAESSQ